MRTALAVIACYECNGYWKVFCPKCGNQLRYFTDNLAYCRTAGCEERFHNPEDIEDKCPDCDNADLKFARWKI